MAERNGEPDGNGRGDERERPLKAERETQKAEPKPKRGGFALLAGLIAVTVLAGGVYLLGKTYFTGTTSETAQQAEARIGGPFTLTNQDGETVTQETYAGKFKLVFFGYTFCPDICPTTLTDISNVMDELPSAKAEEVVPLFISVDPERDTPAHLKEYIGFFDPRIRGLTGTPEQIAEVTKQYKVYYKKANENPDDPGDYLMDHSSIIYLMGPEGRFRTHFSHGTRVETMVDTIAKEIEKGA